MICSVAGKAGFAFAGSSFSIVGTAADAVFGSPTRPAASAPGRAAEQFPPLDEERLRT